MSITVELCQKTDHRCQSLGRGESKERDDRQGQNYYQYIIFHYDLIYCQSNIIDSWEEENERKGMTGTRAEVAQDDERRKGKPS